MVLEINKPLCQTQGKIKHKESQNQLDSMTCLLNNVKSKPIPLTLHKKEED